MSANTGFFYMCRGASAFTNGRHRNERVREKTTVGGLWVANKSTESNESIRTSIPYKDEPTRHTEEPTCSQNPGERIFPPPVTTGHCLFMTPLSSCSEVKKHGESS